MSEIHLSEETKSKLIRYVAKLLKSEDEEDEKPYNTLFGKELGSNAIVEGATGIDVLTTQTQLMNSQIDELTSKIHGNEQKSGSFDKQFRALQIVNKAFLYIYLTILVGVKGLMVFHYINGTILRNKWIDSIVLTLLFIYPYTIYSLEVYVYNLFVWISSLIYNSTSGSEFDSVFTNTSVYRSPDPEDRIITTA